MEISELFKFAGSVITVLNFLIMLVVAYAGWCAFRKLTTNDLKHLDAKVDLLDLSVRETNKSVLVLSENIAYIRGVCDGSGVIAEHLSTRRKTNKRKVSA
jgi:hypothetical protein